MRLYTPSGIMDYVAGQYSISEIDTPLSGHVLAFSEKGDFLAMSVEFTMNDVVSVVLELDDGLAEKILGVGIGDAEKLRSDGRVIQSAGRLLSVFDEEDQTAFMAKHIFPQFFYCGRAGGAEKYECIAASSEVQERGRDGPAAMSEAAAPDRSEAADARREPECDGSGP